METRVEVNTSYDYTYPMGLDLKPGSKLHSKLVAAVRSRAEESKSEMSKRYPIWEKVRDKLTCFVAEEDIDPRDQELLDKNANTPATVIVPASYAILDTILTYYITAFGDGPMFRYDAVGPEDHPNAKMLEHVVNNQAVRSKMLLNLYVQFRDALAYGLGISSVRWHEDFGRRTVEKPVEIGYDPLTGAPMEIMKSFSERIKIYEGSVIDNIQPINYFPDTSVACHKIQDGEFVSFLTRTNYVSMLALERDNPDIYFNVQYVKGDHGTSFLRESLSEDGLVHPDQVSNGKPGKSKSIDKLCFYWNLIPSEWGLGKSPYPEKWLIEIAGSRDIIVRCQPINLNHNKYPIVVCAPTFDGYSAAPSALLEVIYELQNAIDWLWRARFRNVNSAMNNKFIIDPFLARYDQAISTDSNVVCIREHVWGRGVENAMKQLEVSDVTASHIRDIGYLSDIMQRVSGAVDSVQGVVRPTGERRSATEMRDARMSALSRIQKGTRIASLQCMYDLGFLMGYHTQQFMSRDTYVKLIGDSYRDLVNLYGTDYVKVSPSDIQMEFDVTPADAVTPGGEYLPELIQMFQLTSSNPITAQAYDPVRQTLDLYQRAGVKGAYRFLLLPDELAKQQAQMMNAVPVDGATIQGLQGLNGGLNATPRPSK